MKSMKVSSIEQFQEIIKGKSLICYGAGRAFRNLCSWLSEAGMLERIRCVTDGNNSLWGTSIRLSGEHNIPVVPPDQLRHDRRPDDIVVIAATENIALEIRASLDDLPELSDVLCLEYGNIRDIYFSEIIRSARLPDSFRITDEPLIPKVIHYCWFGGNPIPDTLRRYIDSWHKFCPDYEIVRWDESNYDYKKNKYTYDAYEAKKWSFVSDYARLDIIYTYGGIYLDTDVEIIRSLDDFLYQEGFGGWQPDGRFATGLGFGAIKEHPFIRSLMQDYDEIKFVDFSQKRERYTKKIKIAPDIQTDFLHRKGYAWNNSVTDVDGFRIYPAPVLCASFSADGKPFITDKTYTIHHFAGTWVPDK